MNTKPVPLTKSLQNCVRFARFCAEHKADPHTLAQLIAAAQKYKRKWELSTWDNSTSGRYLQQAHKWHARAEELAAQMGFGIDWPGLWPHLTRDGRDYQLPVD